MKGKYLRLLAIVAVFSLGAFNFSFVLLNAREMGVGDVLIPVVYAVVNVTHTVIETPITNVLVARTRRGICALYMGDSEPQLVDALKEEYPYASITRDDKALRDAVEPLASYFEGEDYNPRLPLDIHRTAFQWKGLKAIQEIPPGETRTYSELAESIGNPRAVRAVASACARNPVGILDPCHRVLRKDGGLGGYRWGLPLKERLLEHESR